MDWVTFDATKKSWWSVPTYNGVDMFRYGVVSLAHLIPSGLFQSRLLYVHLHSHEKMNESFQSDPLKETTCYIISIMNYKAIVHYNWFYHPVIIIHIHLSFLTYWIYRIILNGISHNDTHIPTICLL